MREPDQLVVPESRRSELLFQIESVTRSRDTAFAIALARVLLNSIAAAGSMKTLLLSVALKRKENVNQQSSTSTSSSSTNSIDNNNNGSSSGDDFDGTQLKTLEVIGKPLIDEIIKFAMW